MESASGFQKLISQLPKTFDVLDIGAGGLQGENTTNFLIEHFDAKNILGVCWAEHDVRMFKETRVANKMAGITIVPVDYFKLELKQGDLNKNEPWLFDLMVLDLNIEGNLKNWTKEGLEHASKFVKPGGYLINYIMLTDEYGDPDETPKLIREHWKAFWETEKLEMKNIGKRLSRISGWEVFAQEREKRREYILWIMLKKTSGL